mmetsp:Transcript_79975/g.246662  ORF Transcript_79975/g.246662 Transcript_79975/m.246662 type:complete len:370 (-) Transcript_79975:805-1914(-)
MVDHQAEIVADLAQGPAAAEPPEDVAARDVQGDQLRGLEVGLAGYGIEQGLHVAALRDAQGQPHRMLVPCRPCSSDQEARDPAVLLLRQRDREERERLEAGILVAAVLALQHRLELSGEEGGHGRALAAAVRCPVLAGDLGVRSAVRVLQGSIRLCPGTVEVLIQILEKDGQELLGVLLLPTCKLVPQATHHALEGLRRDNQGALALSACHVRKQIRKGHGQSPSEAPSALCVQIVQVVLVKVAGQDRRGQEALQGRVHVAGIAQVLKPHHAAGVAGVVDGLRLCGPLQLQKEQVSVDKLQRVERHRLVTWGPLLVAAAPVEDHDGVEDAVQLACHLLDFAEQRGAADLQCPLEQELAPPAVRPADVQP